MSSTGTSQERIALDAIKAVVVISVTVAMTILGMSNVVDAAAVTGVLGAVVGAAGSQAGATVGARAGARTDNPPKNGVSTND